jgi:hypothetical protein
LAAVGHGAVLLNAETTRMKPGPRNKKRIRYKIRIKTVLPNNSAFTLVLKNKGWEKGTVAKSEGPRDGYWPQGGKHFIEKVQ